MPNIGIGGINESETEITNSKWDIFSPEEIETEVSTRDILTVRPVSFASSNGPFKFTFPLDSEKWTDLSHLVLNGKVRIRKRKSDGKEENFDETIANYSVVNNFYHSLFDSVEGVLNGVSFKDPTTHWYPFKSYLETALSYSANTKINKLAQDCYIEDTIGKEADKGVIDETALTTTTKSHNQGYLDRQKLFAKSKWNYFNINLHCDLTTMKTHLPPGITIDIILTRNKDSFSLLTDFSEDTIFIELTDLTLQTKRYLPEIKIQKYFSSKIAKNNAILHFDETRIKTYTKPTGSTELGAYSLIFGEKLPDQIILFMIDSDAYNGNIKTNPFHLKHFNIYDAYITINNTPYPKDSYKLDIEKGDTAKTYKEVLANIGIGRDDRDIGLSMERYLSGSFFLAWDRCPMQCNRFNAHKDQSGNIEFYIKTSVPLKKPVTVLVYLTYSAKFEFDSSNTIIYDKKY